MLNSGCIALDHLRRVTTPTEALHDCVRRRHVTAPDRCTTTTQDRNRGLDRDSAGQYRGGRHAPIGCPIP